MEQYLRYVRDRLLTEHKVVEKALIQYLDMLRSSLPKGSVSTEQLDRIFETLERYLVPHIDFEEKEVLPLLRDEDLASELSREHDEILQVLRRAKRVEDVLKRMELLERLANRLARHLEKEETMMLPQILG